MSSEISNCQAEENRDSFQYFRIWTPCREVHNSNEIAFIKYSSELQLPVACAILLCKLKGMLYNGSSKLIFHKGGHILQTKSCHMEDLFT